MILITGASGNVGREVLKQAVLSGLRVRAAYQSPERARVPAGVEVVRVDFIEPATLDSKMRHLVKLSAMGGREATFPRQHAESEDAIRKLDVSFTFLRPNGSCRTW